MYIIIYQLNAPCDFYHDSIVMIGHDQRSNEPMGCVRRTLLFPCRILVRIGMYALGFNWVTVKKHPSNGAKANLIVANHIGMFDSLYFLVYHFPSVAMKADLKHVPILGTILRSVQVIKDLKSKNDCE